MTHHTQIDHHKAIRQSFVLLGLAISLLLLTILMYISISANSSKAYSLGSVSPISAKTNQTSNQPSKSPSAVSTNTKLNQTDAKIIENIDQLFANEYQNNK